MVNVCGLADVLGFVSLMLGFDVKTKKLPNGESFMVMNPMGESVNNSVQQTKVITPL